jgi:hypothetical protein
VRAFASGAPFTLIGGVQALHVQLPPRIPGVGHRGSGLEFSFAIGYFGQSTLHRLPERDMYHKIARGYATAYLSKLQSYDNVEAWFHGPKCLKPLNSFEASCQSKKPGRCAKRLLPLVRPVFEQPRVGLWTKDVKLVLAVGVSSAQESQVFEVSQDETPRFSERAAFLSNLIFSEIGGYASAQIMTVANISHHAITRILERDMSTPEKIKKDVRNILEVSRNLGMSFQTIDMDKSKAYSFLVPYKGGALPVVTMRVNASSREAKENQWVMSVRTYLAPEMVKAEDEKRMEGFEAAIGDFEKPRKDSTSEDIERWMKLNARPWVSTETGEKPASSQ